jgi:putative spermidine/putrescine transport system permease protein
LSLSTPSQVAAPAAILGRPLTLAADRRRTQASYEHPRWWQAEPGRLWLLLLVPTIVLFGVFFLYPLLKIALQSIFLPQFGLKNYARIFGSSTYLLLIWNTVRISFEVAIGTLLVGYPIAAWLSRIRGPMLAFGMLLVMLPLWTSALVRNYAWIIVLRRGGPVSNFIEALGFSTPNLLYNEGAVLLGMIYTLLPYMVFTLYNSMRNIDGRLTAAAQGLGASPIKAFFKVYLPLSMPAVSAATLLVFIIAIGFFITPALLGGGHVQMIAPQIDMQMNELTDWGFGAALSVVLFVIVVLVMLVSVGIFDVEALGFEKRGTQAPVAEDTMASTEKLDMAAARRLVPMPQVKQVTRAFSHPRKAIGPALHSAFSFFILAVLFLPIIVIAGSSFTASTYIAFPPQGWTLDWYRQVLGDRGWIEAAILSFKAASLSALCAVVIGTITALCLVRGRFAGRQAIYLLILAPMIVPTIVLAVGIYFLYIELRLLGTIWSFIFVYTVQSVPIVVLVVSSALRRVNISLERSAVILGASPIRAFFSITMPAIWPSIAAAGLFSFIHAFDDVVVAEFIAGTTVATLPKKMWVSLVYSIDPTISVVSTVFVVISVVILTAITLMQSATKRAATPAA